MEKIELGGKEYALDWTFMSEEYIEMAAGALKAGGNIAKAAIMAVAALRGGDWTFDKGPDWVLGQIGRDGRKMQELSEKVLKVFNEFNELNNYEERLEAKQGNSESPRDTGAKD